MKRPIFLTLSDVIQFHTWILHATGGMEGLRDQGLLESAMAMPMQGFGGQFVHRDLAEMAAAYAFHIGQNHAFVDGNKRTALMACMIFLTLNGVTWDTLTLNDVVEGWILQVANKVMTKSELANKLRSVIE